MKDSVDSAMGMGGGGTVVETKLGARSFAICRLVGPFGSGGHVYA